MYDERMTGSSHGEFQSLSFRIVDGPGSDAGAGAGAGAGSSTGTSFGLDSCAFQ